MVPTVEDMIWEIDDSIDGTIGEPEDRLALLLWHSGNQAGRRGGGEAEAGVRGGRQGRGRGEGQQGGGREETRGDILSSSYLRVLSASLPKALPPNRDAYRPKASTAAASCVWRMALSLEWL